MAARRHVLGPVLRPPPAAAPRAVLVHAARLWWRHAAVFTGLLAVENGAVQALQERGGERPETGLALVLASVVIGSAVEGAATFGALREAAGRRVGLPGMLEAASGAYGRLLAVNALCVLAVVTGALLSSEFMPLPYVFAQSVTLIALPVALAEPELGVGDVLRRTWELPRGRRLLPLLVATIMWALDLGQARLRAAVAAASHAPPWALAAAEVAVASLVGGFVVVFAVSFYAGCAAVPPPPRG